MGFEKRQQRIDMYISGFFYHNFINIIIREINFEQCLNSTQEEAFM